MLDDLKHFDASYYRRPSTFDLMTQDDARDFFCFVVGLGFLADVLGWL